MQFRRWWKSATLAFAVAAYMCLPAPSLQAAPIDVQVAADTLKKLTGKEAADYRALILKEAPAGVIEKNSYGQSISKAFEPLLADSNPDAALNAIITVVELDVLFSDVMLKRAVSNKSPAIRYWAAKGLGNLMGRIREVGENAVNSTNLDLLKQLEAESSGVVKQQILRAIAASEEAGAIATALTSVAKAAQATAPDIATLQGVTVALDALTRNAAKLKDAPKAASLSATAQILSYAAQHNDRLSGKGTLPAGQTSALVDSARAGVALINAIAGKQVGSLKQVNNRSGTAEVLIEVFGIVGSPTVDGALQKNFPAIAKPGQIKAES